MLSAGPSASKRCETRQQKRINDRRACIGQFVRDLRPTRKLRSAGVLRSPVKGLDPSSKLQRSGMCIEVGLHHEIAVLHHLPRARARKMVENSSALYCRLSYRPVTPPEFLKCNLFRKRQLLLPAESRRR